MTVEELLSTCEHLFYTVEIWTKRHTHHIYMIKREAIADFGNCEVESWHPMLDLDFEGDPIVGIEIDIKE